MRLHGNARTCPKSRRRIVAAGRTEAVAAAGVSERTARKWVARFKRCRADRVDHGPAPAAQIAAEIAEARDGALDRVVRPADRPPRVVRPLRSPLIVSWRQARSSDGGHRHRLCDSLA